MTAYSPTDAETLNQAATKARANLFSARHLAAEENWALALNKTDEAMAALIQFRLGIWDQITARSRS